MLQTTQRSYYHFIKKNLTKTVKNIILKNPQQAILQKANFWKPFYIHGTLYCGTGFGPPFQGPEKWLDWPNEMAWFWQNFLNIAKIIIQTYFTVYFSHFHLSQRLHWMQSWFFALSVLWKWFNCLVSKAQFLSLDDETFLSNCRCLHCVLQYFLHFLWRCIHVSFFLFLGKKRSPESSKRKSDCSKIFPAI